MLKQAMSDEIISKAVNCGSRDKSWRKTCGSLVFGVDIVLGVLTVASFTTRFVNLNIPSAVVFDELQYGRFVGLYLNRTFFFDTNPPFGTMLIAFVAWLAGFDGEFVADHIGQSYPSSVPVWYLRLVPALLGALLPVVVYYLMLEFHFTRWTAVFAAAVIIMENSILVQSRFLLMESILLFVMVIILLSERKFSSENKIRQWSMRWCFWLFCLGLSTALGICVRYVGVFTAGLVLYRVGVDYWNMLPHGNQYCLLKHFVVRVFALILIPLFVYTSVFYVHLCALNRTGPHDDLMTSAFQSSLQGGLSDITHGQPSVVAYGAQLTLRRTNGVACWLHSDDVVYPLQYDDSRGSSHQQVVTCSTHKDVNNWWIVKHPRSDTLVVDDPILPIRNGDVIQLIHGMTERSLNSHDVAAPLSPHCQEVSCYIDYNVSSLEQSLWQVHVINGDVDGYWIAIKSHIRLVHLNTSQVLKTSGKRLGAWADHQFEVVTDRVHTQSSAIWNVEEHRYFHDDDDSERDTYGDRKSPLGFFSKFWELQVLMLMSQHASAREHVFSCEAVKWPLMERNIIYWIDPLTNAQIHFLGNPVIWFTAIAGVVVYMLMLMFFVLRRQRACYDLTEDMWRQLTEVGRLLLIGYLVHYVPYLLIDRTLFLYHYLPALLFSILLLAANIGLIGNIIQLHCPSLTNAYRALIIVWLSVAAAAFVTVSAVTYGNVNVTDELVSRLQWLDSWQFTVY